MTKTYAEYQAEAKKRKFNPALMAPPEAKLPSSMRPKKTPEQLPPLNKKPLRRVSGR